jgi:hypothetical protein
MSEDKVAYVQVVSADDIAKLKRVSGTMHTDLWEIQNQYCELATILQGDATNLEIQQSADFPFGGKWSLYHTEDGNRRSLAHVWLTKSGDQEWKINGEWVG